jgi:hypothetical protein
MGVDEQKEEREVLDSIFPDEITGMYFETLRDALAFFFFFSQHLQDVSETEYRLSIALDVTNDDDDDDDSEPRMSP